jgi:hypothetical protein
MISASKLRAHACASIGRSGRQRVLVQLTRRIRVALWAGLVVTVLLSAVPAAAQQPVQFDEATRMAARELAREGLDLLKAGKYVEAQDRLHRAHAIVPAPTVRLLEGRALEGMDKLVEAAEAYEQVRRTKLEDDAPEAYARATKEAVEDLRRVRPQIPTVTVMLEGIGHATPGFEIRVDGVQLPAELLGAKRPVNPGSHEVVATLDGKVVERRELLLKPKQHERVLIRVQPRSAPASVQPTPAAPPPADQSDFPYRPVAWGSLGLGGAGLATGAVFLVIMLNKQSTLDEHCEDQICPSQYQDDLDMYRRARTFSTIGFVVGALGVGAGFTLLHLAPQGKRAQPGGQVQARIGPGQIGLLARF